MVLEGDFRLGEWLVKPHTNTVVGPTGEAHMEPKAMQVLAALAERPGEVATKQDLLAEVWDGTFVSEEVLPNAIWEIRRVLGDDARKPRFIQTLPKKGYRLIAPVGGATAPTGTSGLGLVWRSRWLPVAALLGVAVICAMMADWRQEPARSSRTPEDPYPVLVMDFEDHTSSEELAWLSSGIATMLETGLAELAGVAVISDESLDRALAELGGDGPGRLEAARSTGAEAIVVGSIFRDGAELRIDVQIEDTIEPRIVAAHSVRGADVFALMDELTGRVRDSLELRGARGLASRKPIRDVTTTSLEAFRLYSEGVEARRHLRLADARRLLTEAVQIDPSFALAYLELQWVALWSADAEAYEEYATRTAEHIGRLPEHKRFLMEAHRLWKEGDPAASEEILLDVIERRPEEEDAYLKLSHLYRMEGPQRSLEVLERGILAVPHSGYLRLHYGYALLWAGRFPEAIHQLELYARIHPKEPNPWDSMGEAYLVAGVPERALEYYARALELDPGFPSSYIGRSWALAQLGRYDEALKELSSLDGDLPPGYSEELLRLQEAFYLSRVGRYREAEGVLAEAAAQANDSTAAGVLLLEALLHLEKEEAAQAYAKAEKARQLVGAEVEPPKSLDLLAELLSGIAACRLERLEEADERLESLRAKHRSELARERWWVHLLAGELELARDNPRAAYLTFAAGEPAGKLRFNVLDFAGNLSASLPLRDATARALAVEGSSEAAVALYEKQLRPDIGQRWTAALEPRYHLAIARLHAGNGNREDAARHYREFLELWSEADKELPELREAEAFLASS